MVMYFMESCCQSWHSLISMQVDGKYEDWMEVLRLLIYYGGGFKKEYVLYAPGFHAWHVCGILIISNFPAYRF